MEVTKAKAAEILGINMKEVVRRIQRGELQAKKKTESKFSDWIVTLPDQKRELAKLTKKVDVQFEKKAGEKVKLPKASTDMPHAAVEEVFTPLEPESEPELQDEQEGLDLPEPEPEPEPEVEPESQDEQEVEPESQDEQEGLDLSEPEPEPTTREKIQRREKLNVSKRKEQRKEEIKWWF